jgi:metal-responsive CopG/Arc/MetJ family transcriptional regulator
MSPATYDRQFTVQVTEQMLSFVDLMANRQRTSRAEVTRQALREYLDAQEKLIGSRSRLGRTVMDQLQVVQNRLMRQLNHMSALLLSAVILQQIQQGESGSRVMDQIVQLADQIEEALPEAAR